MRQRGLKKGGRRLSERSHGGGGSAGARGRKRTFAYEPRTGELVVVCQGAQRRCSVEGCKVRVGRMEGNEGDWAIWAGRVATASGTGVAAQ